MIYLRDFETEEQYDESTGNTYSIPNVSSIRENGPDVRYNEYYNAPLTFQIIGDEDYAEGDTYSIFLNFDGEDTSYLIDGIQYRINGGEWIYADFDEYEIDGLKPGDQVQFFNEYHISYAGEDTSLNLVVNYFYCDTRFNVFGNINSLNDYDDQIYRMQYVAIFRNNVGLVSAKNLILPSMELEEMCYESMFQNCTSLTSAPELPATTLAVRCYQNMFLDCTSLTSAPELPATTLASYCYGGMFNGCTSLTKAPELPATTLANYCYYGMFVGCTSLAKAPELPATTLAIYCYYNMFGGCKSLTTVPSILPATALTTYCYQSMFRGCTSLTRAPELPATTLETYCYGNMFQGCTSLTKTPELPATTLVSGCYFNMFRGCTNLNYIKCLATNISASNCTSNWVLGVQTTSGTFIKNSSMTSWTRGTSGIPTNWTVVDNS